MKNKLKKIITVPRLNLALVTVLVGFVAYTLFAPIVPAVYDKPVVQDTANISAGHKLTYKLHSCRYVGDGVLTTVTRKLVSTTDKTLQPINLSTDTFTNTAKCLDVEKTLIVPYSTPAGTYQLVITGVYQVIPLRKPITVTAVSDSFHINGATATEQIQALIDANNQLQEQLKAQLEAVAVQPTSNGSAQTSKPTTNNITNNTTNNNTTTNNPKDPEVKGNGSGGQGLIPGLIQALGGGGIKLGL